MFSFFLDIYLGMELLDHMVTIYLTFWGTARLFLVIDIPSLQRVKVPVTLHFHQHLLLSFFFF